MAQFLVLVDGETGGWSVDREALTAAMQGRWSEVEFDGSDRSPVRSCCWSMEAEPGPGEAYLHEQGTCLYLDLWLEDAAWLAVTFRRLAPAELDVVFCDEGYSFDIHLRPEVTVDELVESVPAA